MPSHTLWDQCKSELKQKLNPHNFESWIDPIDCISFKGSNLILSVPSRFFVEWIEEHYLDTIGEIMERLVGKPVTTHIIVIPAEEKSASPKAKGVKQKTTRQEKQARAGTPIKSNLNEKYTFESFVVGKSNEFCHASAKAVVKKLGQTYNPLFLYGGVGLGKTHLMQAIGNAALEKNPDLNVLYISSEKFVNDLINSLQRGAMASFRRKYRDLDLLLVDDIQFIGGKERTQEEFFHTFNTLFQEKKQIVVSSDKFPKQITNLEERLRSRFAWGLIADISPPELEIKIAIVEKSARVNGFTLTKEVSAFLAGRIKSNIRELEGCLARVMAYASLTGAPIDLEMARSTLKGIYDDTADSIDIRQIQKEVASFFELRVSDLKSKSRKTTVSIPRHIAIYLSREYTQNSLPEIGRAFGGRDHTTVMHSVAKIKEELNINTRIYNQITEIKKALDL